MRLAVLTTNTPHHTYFVRELARSFPAPRVLAETEEAAAPFDTYHAFEADQEQYELRTLGAAASLYDVAETVACTTVNAPRAQAALRATSPDCIIAYGVGSLDPTTIDLCPRTTINVHCGDPERYRGHDTHLWASYHGEFDEFVMTVHVVERDLESGEIVLQAPTPVSHGMGIHELRARQAETAVHLAKSALAMLEREGRFYSRPQRQRGRRYSQMPTALKEISRRQFERYTAQLP